MDSNRPGAQRPNYYAIAGLALALAGLFAYDVVLGPIGAILGGVGLAQAQTGAGLRRTAIAAIVIGIAGPILYVIAIAA